MFDDSNIVVSNNGSSLNFYKLTCDYEIDVYDMYSLPFTDKEFTPISLSNNKKLIVIGGLKCIVVSIIIQDY